VVFLNFVFTAPSSDDILRIKQFYLDYQTENNNPSIIFFAKSEFVTVSVYKSGKVMFQGKDAKEEYQMWQTMLGYQPVISDKKVIPNSPVNYFYSSIGSDEVGTGDFFGPIVVCAFYLSKEHISQIKSLGINDSKKLTDRRIMELGPQIKDMGEYSLLVLHNEKYNDLVKRGFNMNKIKAYLHNKAILNLLKKIDGTPQVVLDQFTPERNYFQYLSKERNVYQNITFRTKAESKYASVALGSILARYAFLQYFEKLAKESGYNLLKGAGPKVDMVAATMIKELGIGQMVHYAKLNFKNLQKAQNLLNE
jgi:ribonuclease HIII